jgi:hypothetical protein
MPMEMAGAWLGIGAAMIVALLLVCTVLPRRNAEYSVTHLPIFAGSPTDLWTTDMAVGDEGQQEDDGDRPGEGQSESDQPGDQGKPSGDQPTGNGQSSGEDEQPGGDDGSGNQREGGQSGKDPSGDQKGGGQSGGSQSGGEQDQKNRPEPNGETSGDNKQKGGNESENSPPAGESPNDQPRNKRNPQSREKDQPNQRKGDPSDESETTGDQDRREKSPSSRQDEQEQKTDRRTPPQGRSKSDSPRQPQSKFDPSKLAQALGGSIGQLMKLLYWIVVILIVAYVAWRYHREIRQAIANFLRAMREFWESLFGRRVTDEAEAEAAAVEAGPPPKPFAAFPDPFLSGMAQSRPAAEVIRYSFEAFEAWAREHGYPRAPEQTPHEYVQLVGQSHTTVARDAVALAELYCRCAYGKDPAPRSSLEHLRRLWEQLRATAA